LTEQYTSTGGFYFGTATAASNVAGVGSGKYVASVQTGLNAPFAVTATFRTTGVSTKLLAAANTGASVHLYYNPNSGSWTCATGMDDKDDTTILTNVISGTPSLATVAQVGKNPLATAILPKSCQ
jgi:hypothetical protein